MPTNPTARRSAATRYDPWSFNLRTHQYVSESESDGDLNDELEPARAAHATSDDALLNDLDISSRHDTAEFKPNPWTIAKVNAASRPKPLAQNSSTNASAKVAGHTKRPRAGTILDAFAKQAEKTASRKAMAVHLAQEPEHGLTLGSDHITVHTPLHSPAQVSMSRANAFLPHTVLSGGAPPNALSQDLKLPRHSPQQHHTPSRFLARSTSPVLDCAPLNAYSGISKKPAVPWNVPVQTPRVFQTGSAELPATPIRPKIPSEAHVSAIKSTDDRSLLLRKPPQTPIAALLPSIDPEIQVPRSTAQRKISSGRGGYRPSEDPRFCGLDAALPGRSEGLDRNRSAGPRSSTTPSKPDASSTLCSWPVPSSKASSTVLNRSTRSPYCDTSSGLRSSCGPHVLASPVLVSVKNEDLVKPFCKQPLRPVTPAVHAFDISAKPGSSGSRSHSSRSGTAAKRDAYTALGDSPDSSWRTLPARKARTAQAADSGSTTVKRGGGFKLPGISLRGAGAKMLQGNVGGRRVVTYIPPPRESTRADGGTRGAPDSVLCSRSPQDTWSSPLVGADCVSPPGFSRTPMWAGRLSPPVLSSPVSGSSTLVEFEEDASDMRARFDMEGVGLRYASTRVQMKEQRRLAGEVWELLDLPSCGVVFLDEEAGGLNGGLGKEVKIVVWAGRA